MQNPRRRRRYYIEIELHARGLELDFSFRSRFGAVGCRILVDVDDFTLKLGSTLAVWRNGASNLCRRRRFGVEIEFHARGLELDFALARGLEG